MSSSLSTVMNQNRNYTSRCSLTPPAQCWPRYALGGYSDMHFLVVVQDTVAGRRPNQFYFHVQNMMVAKALSESSPHKAAYSQQDLLTKMDSVSKIRDMVRLHTVHGVKCSLAASYSTNADSTKVWCSRLTCSYT